MVRRGSVHCAQSALYLASRFCGIGRHLIGEVVHGDDLGPGLIGSGVNLRLLEEVLLPVIEFGRPLLELLLALFNLLNGMGALSGVEDDTATELRVRRRRERGEGRRE